MEITSPVFENNGKIPQKYTCDGEDINPPLKFEDIPSEAASLALIVSDPDAPGKTFYHWLLFNMDPGTDHIDEDSVPSTAIEGKNDSEHSEYSGPCPPSGIHKYIFTLYALDGPLDLEAGATAEEILEAIEGHVIDAAQIIGTYGR
ncbi:MAG: YbhB/YbcL family Raf kinase inhibitor-like protein [Patescibacteria group bacterium]|nr:YbhB/YbcL family Raf kinase inhibitor-like protein [Patescibacteria group bacterium]